MVLAIKNPNTKTHCTKAGNGGGGGKTAAATAAASGGGEKTGKTAAAAIKKTVTTKTNLPGDFGFDLTGKEVRRMSAMDMHKVCLDTLLFCPSAAPDFVLCCVCRSSRLLTQM